MKAVDVLKLIQNRYNEKNGWVVLPEVGQGTGSLSGRRADAVAYNMWPSKGLQVHGFEIKVSRQDFLSEMRDPMKSEAVRRYCDAWWLVAPPGIAKPDELPEGWGLYEAQSSRLVLRKQAARKTGECNRVFLASTLQAISRVASARVEREVANRVAEFEARLPDMVEARVSRMKSEQIEARAWIKRFEDRLGEPFDIWRSPEDLADKLRLANKLTPQVLRGLADAGSVARGMLDGDVP